jgi:CrcB protein
MLTRIVFLALAGAAGTLARYGLGGLVHRFDGAAFPWGTLAANVVGCMLFGAVWALSAERGILSPQVRTVCLIGFLGAFTTFSSYVFETAQMAAGKQWLLAAGNFGLENGLGFLALVAGIWLGRIL